MDKTILFLCDGEKEDCRRTHCYKNTNDEPCKRTTDINHAKNFEKCHMEDIEKKKTEKHGKKKLKKKSAGVNLKGIHPQKITDEESLKENR